MGRIYGTMVPIVLLLAGCSLKFSPTTPTLYQPAGNDTYRLTARIDSGAFVYAISPKAVPDNSARVMRLQNQSSSGLTVRSTWQSDYVEGCSEGFRTYYAIRYYIFPFFPADTRYPEGSGTIETVVQRAVASITVSGPQVLVSRSQQFLASLRDAANCVLTRPAITWTSDSPAVATVSQTGVVTGISQGTATIAAAAEGVTGALQITVGPAPTLTSLTIAGPDPIVLEVNASHQLAVTATWSDGVTANVTAAGSGTTYTSSDTAAAQVTFGGRITAIAGPRTVVITAGNSGVTAQRTVQIPAPITAIGVTPNPVTLTTTNSQATLSVTGMRSDGTQSDITNAAETTYSAVNGAIVTMGSSTATRNVATFRGRGHTGINVTYQGVTSLVSTQAVVCNEAAQGGSFSPSSGSSSTGTAVLREVLSNRHDRVTIFKTDDRALAEFILDKPAGDQISVHFLTREYIVAVHTLGGDHVMEVLQGGEYVFQITPFEGIRRVHIYNAKAALGYQEERSRQVLQTDLAESDGVFVFFSPDSQLVNIRVDRSWRSQNSRTHFYKAFDQEQVLSATHDPIQSGAVYTASHTFTPATCSGQITWTVDQPPNTRDDTGTGSYQWPPN